MKKTLLLICIFLLCVSVSKADSPRVANAIPTGLGSVVNPDFGGDVIVANANPIGSMSGIRTQSGTIYAAVNDTILTTNLGLIILQSSNNGNNWTLFGQGIGLRAKFEQLKFVKTTDSVYCFFRYVNSVYRWNPGNGTVKAFDTTTIVDYDVCVSTDNNIYLFYQTVNNQFRRHGSTDGGFTWTGSGLIANTAGSPRVYRSATGDTIHVNYRGPLRTDFPEKSIWRSVSYRQTGPGVLATVTGTFIDILTDTSIVRSELKSVRNGATAWTVYTEGTTGSLNIKMISSVNGGTVYTAPISIAANPNRDEYWFDIGLSQGLISGLDITYYTDSLQAGTPTNASDKMSYQYSPSSAPGTVGPPVYFSTNPPVWSSNGAKPSLVELPASDFGVLFLGYTGTGNKVFWNRFSQLTNISHNANVVADKFELKQNYPNPFNPTTNITFNLPKNAFVNLKVYDLSGKEVAKLVSQNMNQGNYTVTFDGKNLSSGVYFYKLESDNFSEVKKMSLIK